MRIKYLVFILLFIGLNLFFWYYIIAFSSIYPQSSLGWIYSTIITLIFLKWFGFSLFIPLVFAVAREIAKKKSLT